MSEQEKAKDWASTVVGGQSYACCKRPSVGEIRELPEGEGAFAGATGSVPPLWAVEAGCLIINTYLHRYHGQDMNENDVADIITRCYLAAQNIARETTAGET